MVVLPENKAETVAPAELGNANSARASTFRRIFGKDSVINMDAKRGDAFQTTGNLALAMSPKAHGILKMVAKVIITVEMNARAIGC